MTRGRAATAEVLPESCFRTLVDTAPHGILVYGLDGRILYTNTAFADTFGFDSPASVLKMSSIDRIIVETDLLQTGVSGRVRASRRPTQHHETFRGRRADGSRMWVDVVFERVEWLGEPAFYATVRDVSRETEEREEQVRHTHVLMASFEHMEEAILVADSDYRIVAYNRQLPNLFEIPLNILDEPDGYKAVIRFLAERGDLGPMGVDEALASFLDPAHAGASRRYRITRPGHRVIEAHGSPLPSGGFVVLYRDVTEQHRAAEALRASEARLRHILETSPVGIAIYAVDGKRLYANPRLATLYGVASPDMLLGVNVDESFTHTADIERLRSVRHSNGVIHDWEVERRRPDGSTWWSLTSAGPVEFADQPARIAWLIDISERKRAAAAQVAAAELLEAAIAAMADGIVMLDAEMNVVVRNRRVYEFLGLEPGTEEGLARPEPWRDMLAPLVARGDLGPGCVDDHIARMVTAADEALPIRLTLPRLPDARADRVLEMHVNRRRGGGFVLTYTDTTNHKKLEKELAHDKATLEIVLENIEQGLALFGPDMRLAMWNRRWVELLALPPDVVASRPPLEQLLLHQLARGDFPEEPEALEEKLRRLLDRAATAGRPYWQEFMTWDGRTFEEYTRPVPGGGFVRMLTDVSEQRNQDRALRDAMRAADAASRAKSDFLATMSHEIRTPMNGVVGVLELLRQNGLDGEQDELAQVAQQSADALMTLLDQVLDFSKAEARKLELSPEPTDLRLLIENTVAGFRPLATRRALRLTVEVTDEVPPVVDVDPIRLRQVVLNLVGNAVKFTEQGSVAVVTTVEEHPEIGTAIVVTVRDTGIGIDGSRLEHLFQPFTQADASTTRRFGGTGLGLSISRQLVERMAGVIEVESEVGRGTAFRVSLPLRTVQGAPVPGPPPVPMATAAEDLIGTTLPAHDPFRAPEGRRVLVVEDNPVNRWLLRAQLNKLTVACDLAADGRDALARLEERSYAMVLTDFHMPTMDGFELAREIRRREAGSGSPALPIVGLTADTQSDAFERSRSAGIDTIMTKPVRLDQLRRQLELAAVGNETGGLSPGDTELFVPNETAPLDLSGFVEVFGEINDTVMQMLEVFAKSAADLDARIHQLAEEPDFPGLTRTAHTLAGASLSAGAAELARLSRALQKAAEAEDRESVRERVAPISAEVATVTRWIGQQR